MPTSRPAQPNATLQKIMNRTTDNNPDPIKQIPEEMIALKETVATLKKLSPTTEAEELLEAAQHSITKLSQMFEQTQEHYIKTPSWFDETLSSYHQLVSEMVTIKQRLAPDHQSTVSHKPPRNPTRTRFTRSNIVVSNPLHGSEVVRQPLEAGRNNLIPRRDAVRPKRPE